MGERKQDTYSRAKKVKADIVYRPLLGTFYDQLIHSNKPDYALFHRPSLSPLCRQRSGFHFMNRRFWHAYWLTSFKTNLSNCQHFQKMQWFKQELTRIIVLFHQVYFKRRCNWWLCPIVCGSWVRISYYLACYIQTQMQFKLVKSLYFFISSRLISLSQSETRLITFYNTKYLSICSTFSSASFRLMRIMAGLDGCIWKYCLRSLSVSFKWNKGSKA